MPQYSVGIVVLVRAKRVDISVRSTSTYNDFRLALLRTS